MNQMLGAQMLMMKPNEAINVPAIVTIRQPNLFVSALAIGPTQELSFIMLRIHAILLAKRLTQVPQIRPLAGIVHSFIYLLIYFSKHSCPQPLL